MASRVRGPPVAAKRSPVSEYLDPILVGIILGEAEKIIETVAWRRADFMR
jgi:hypothetical protein